MNREIIIISNIESHKFLGPGMSLFSYFDLKSLSFDWDFKRYGMRGGVFDQLIHHQYARLDDYEEVFLKGNDAEKKTTLDWNIGTANGIRLNGLLLSQHLRNAGWNPVLIMNAATESKKLRALLKRKPFAVVISTTFILEASKIRKLAKTIKKLSPKTYILVGGPKITKNYQAYCETNNNPIGKYISLSNRVFLFNSQFFMIPLLDRYIDVFIPSYPGWKTLLSVLEAISNGQQWRNHKNTICVDFLRNKFIINKMETDYTSINEDEIDWELAYKTNKEYFAFNSQSIEFGRGCPLSCSFCDFTTSNITNKTYDTFVRELESISSLPFITHLRFTDENLFSSKRKLETFEKAMSNFGGRFTWDSTSTSIIHIDEEVAETISKTGCIYLESSMESGDKNLLKNHINKPIYPERFLEKVSILNKHNIDTRISFIVCHPGETVDSINNTLNVIREIPRNGPGINYVEFHKFFLSLDTAFLNSLEGRKKYNLHGVSFKWKTETWDYKKAEEVFQEIVESIEYPSTVNNILIKKELVEFKTQHYLDLVELLKYAHKLTVAQYKEKKIQQIHYADRIREVLINKLLPDYKIASEDA